jgi:hypothetical protein
MRTNHIFSVACPVLQYFYHIISKRHDFREKVTEHEMCVSILSTNFGKRLVILFIQNCSCSYCAFSAKSCRQCLSITVILNSRSVKGLSVETVARNKSCKILFVEIFNNFRLLQIQNISNRLKIGNKIN